MALCILALVLLCFVSIYAPMRFEEEVTKREKIVMQRLQKIQQAQETYKARFGTYASDFKTLTTSGILADSLTNIPFSEGEKFSLETTIIEKGEKQEAQMECGAQYQQYLKGLNENSVANLIEEANNKGQYPGVKIGTLEN